MSKNKSAYQEAVKAYRKFKRAYQAERVEWRRLLVKAAGERVHGLPYGA